MNPLPPQAYTKDTLVQAYAWLQGQSESIKEMATTPDVLVSLYLKAKLQGNQALERPSIQNFKNELKNLAGMIGEFEVVEQQGSTNGNSTEVATSTIRFRSQNLRSSERTSSGTISTQPAPAVSEPVAPSAPLPPPPSASATSHSAETSALSGLDNRSLDMIQEVKIQFNLSSDTEAMRMLIACGYNQVKNLLK